MASTTLHRTNKKIADIMDGVSKAVRLPGAYNYINGQWKASRSGKTFDNINPATGELLGRWPSSAAEDLNEAVVAASEAYASWRLVPAPKRAERILRAYQVLLERKEALAQVMTQEMGKVLKETRGDVQEAIDTALYFAGEGRRLFGVTTTSELADKFAMTVRSSIGVCGLITPWNFPMAIPSWKIFPALLCGNTVVFKPASCTPATATLLVEILEEAGIPAGVVNLVHGSGSVLGQALIESPVVRLISFTGSSEVGSSIAAACGQLFKKVSLEMGGKNAQLVLDDADVDLAIEGALWGAFGTTGQRCTATSRLIIQEGIYGALIEKLVQAASKLKLGNGLDADSQVGPLVSEDQLETVKRYVDIGLREDKARLLLGGRRATEGVLGQGFYFEPTIFEGAPDMRLAQEEIFGPVLMVIKVKTFEQGLQVMNGTRYGLSGSVYTRDVNRVMQAVRDMQTGITYINAPTIGAEVHLPFGGVKHTGNGHREAGQAVLDIFTEWKAVYVDYSGRLQKAQIDQ